MDDRTDDDSFLDGVKYYTLEEAEKALPKVKLLVKELQILHEAIDMLESVEFEFDEEITEEEFEELPPVTRLNKEFHRLSYLFYQRLEQLEAMGCILKDLEQGLIDFWHRFESRDVFLCWKEGEKGIQHWHEIDEGFEGRNQIFMVEKQYAPKNSNVKNKSNKVKEKRKKIDV